MTKVNGLTLEQVNQRVKQGKINKTVDNQFKSDWQIVKENLFTYFNLIFLILAVLLIIVKAYRDLTFLPVIILNTIIGIIQEIRAKRILSKLNVLDSTEITVMRDSHEMKIPIEDLVVDDIILLNTGDQIPADGYVVSGHIRVNESLLTGESDEILKEQNANLLSGSFVVSGKAYMKLEQVGAESYISKLTLEAKKMGSSEQSEMVRNINTIVKWAGIIIIPMGLALFCQSYFLNHASIQQSVVSMEAAVIGMIPEGLYLLTTLALALSAARLAKRKVILHDMKSVETLARVNVLCVDKTGTITEPKMSVTDFISKDYLNQDKFELKVGNFVRNMPAENATMKAIRAHFSKNEGIKAMSVVPFTSVNKYSAVVFSDETIIIGAPEMVLRSDFSKYENEIEQYTSSGYRVLAVASSLEKISESNSQLTQPVILLGYLLLSNPIRKEAKATFEYFAKQGVAIKVISGDNPLTVSRVASQAGIKNSEQYIDAQTIKDDGYETAVKSYTVFGRVKPEQKRKLVLALQNIGNTVAMTGDGVNDILAMKKADCSIAMASGNSAAVQASQVVLLDSNFAKMPDVVNEGRQVVNNIQRSASLFLVKNVFSLLMAIFALVMTINYPLQPTQLALISGFTIGIPSFLLALESNHTRIRGNFIANILARSIPGGLVDMLTVSVVVVAGNYIKMAHSQVSTIATILLIAVGMLVMYRISRPLNKFRLAVMICSLLGVILAVIFLPRLFAMEMITAKTIFVLVALFCVAITVFRWLSQIMEGVCEVLILYDQKGKSITLKEVIQAYQKARITKA
ncbi:cation-transporting ATPase E [Lactobacillus colini]|uniref:Cation-transporting ATPase E n=1 Tax=Lactobacillus colini TaxID=1819254 RepID=A0ABS4MF03_9LACO|nr:HAD-IC family P-type ATPase [Lactobacillus colini]MBP2058267.1 cation-transporting ATPase E [Lactobacillus colini]